jgi:CBS-domain-containing membrane protein
VFPKSLFDAAESDDAEEELPEETEQPQVDESSEKVEESQVDDSSEELLQQNPSGQSEDLAAEEIGEAANDDEELEEPVIAEQSEFSQIEHENKTDATVTFEKEQMSFLSVPAKEVVDTSTVWADVDDDVQGVLTKMQQRNVSYVIIGKDGVAEGIVSKSDIAGALSPYLKSMFSKWRRPLDDATLKIKVKWIMSRPVYAVNLNTPLLSIIEQICGSSKRCVPVLNEQGKVEGIVTVYDILRFFTKKHTGRINMGRSLQAPALV